MINLPYKPMPFHELYYNSGCNIADLLFIVSILCLILGSLLILVLIFKRKEK